MNALDKGIAKREAAQPPPAPPLSKAKGIFRRCLNFCLAAIGIIALLIGVETAKVVSRKITKRVMAARAQEEQPAPVPNWQRYTVGGVSLESPYPFAAAIDAIPMLPVDYRKHVRQGAYYFTDDETPGTLAIMVGRAEYIGPADPKGAAEGSIRGAAGKLGDSDPKVISHSLGENCHTAAYRSPEGNIDTVAWAHENKLWAVSVIYFDLADMEAVERIMVSLKLVE